LQPEKIKWIEKSPLLLKIWSITIIKCGIDDDCEKGRCSTHSLISEVWKLPTNFESKEFFSNRKFNGALQESFYTLYPIWFRKVP
jgi:hypothetical protein